MRLLGGAVVVALCLGAGCSTEDDDPGGGDTSPAEESGSDDPSTAEMLESLDSARSASSYQAQLSRLATACGMSETAVADLAVHAARNVAPDEGVDISISEMLDAIETNAGGPVGCDEIAAATITLMMGG